MKKQRLEGVAETGEDMWIIKKVLTSKTPKEEKKQMPGNKKAKWAAQSAAFRNAMRAAWGAKPVTETYNGQTYTAQEAAEDNGFV